MNVITGPPNRLVLIRVFRLSRRSNGSRWSPLPPPGHDTAVYAIAGAVLGAFLGGPRHAAGGALLGAAGGAIAGAVSYSVRQEEAQQQEEAYARRNQAGYAQSEQKELDFRRAMGACLEGRGYSVR